MNDFGTVVPRKIGIDDRGFMIRMIPAVRYVPMTRPFEYITKGYKCVLPIDAAAPQRMLREIYRFDEKLVARIMQVLKPVHIQTYCNMSDAEIDALDYPVRLAILLAIAAKNDIVYVASDMDMVPVPDAIIVPMLYAKDTAPIQSVRINPLHVILREYCATNPSGVGADYDFAIGKSRLQYRSYGYSSAPKFAAVGDRWSSYLFDDGLVAPIDELADALCNRTWHSHGHNAAKQAANLNGVYSESTTSFVTFF